MILYWEGGEGFRSEDLHEKLNAAGVATAGTGGNWTSSTTVRANAKGERSIGGGNDFYPTMAAQATLYAEFWMKPGQVASQAVLYFQDSSGLNHVRLERVAASGVNYLRVLNAAGAQVGSDVSIGAALAWVHVGVKVVVGNAGSVTLKINGTTQVSATADTQNGSETTASRVRFYGVTGSGTGQLFDDIVIQDSAGAFLGSAIHSVALLPSAAGDSTQLTPSAGANWACVDEADPNDDTDYVESATAGHVDLYNVAALPALSGAVRGVDVWARAKGPDFIQLQIKTAAAHSAAEDVLDTGYEMTGNRWLTNPSTSAAFTLGEVDSLQIGAAVGEGAGFLWFDGASRSGHLATVGL